MEDMQEAVDAIMTPAIRLWVNWMFIVFVASLLFVYHQRSARIIFLAFVLTLPLAILVFRLFDSVWLLGLSHILIWGPLMIYLIITEKPFTRERIRSFYGTYLLILIATISVSLVLDIRDTAMVIMGMK